MSEQRLRVFVEERVGPHGVIGSSGRYAVALRAPGVNAEGMGTATLQILVYTDASRSSMEDAQEREVVLTRGAEPSDYALLGARLEVFATLLDRFVATGGDDVFTLVARCWPHVDAARVFPTQPEAVSYLLAPETADRSELGDATADLLEQLEIPLRSFLAVPTRALRLVDVAPAQEVGRASDIGTPRTRLGGPAEVPAHFEWPCETSGRPMVFVAQLALDALPLPRPEQLPERGLLSFFMGHRSAECHVAWLAAESEWVKTSPPSGGGVVLPSLQSSVVLSPPEWPRADSARYAALSRRSLTHEERARLSEHLWDFLGARDDGEVRPTSVLGHTDLVGVESGTDRVLLQLDPEPGYNTFLDEQLSCCFIIPDDALSAHDWSRVRLVRAAPRRS